MPFKLNVPFSDKDLAKNKGAFWDADQKTWFVPDHKDINDFVAWFNLDEIGTIIKTPFYIALNTRDCWKCGAETTMISLYSDNFYNLDYENDETENQIFQKVEAKSFFSDITYLDNTISTFLTQNFSFFKFGYSKTIGGKYWANHCEKCNSLQGDFFNHSEPGGAFFPITEDECKKILLIQIPLKFDICIKGGFSYLSNEDEIFELATKKIWSDNLKI
jgi:hypothetical protein